MVCFGRRSLSEPENIHVHLLPDLEDKGLCGKILDASQIRFGSNLLRIAQAPVCLRRSSVLLAVAWARLAEVCVGLAALTGGGSEPVALRAALVQGAGWRGEEGTEDACGRHVPHAFIMNRYIVSQYL